MDPRNRLVVLTGANGGIGAPLADYLLSAGYRNLALCYHNTNDQLLPIISHHGLSEHEVCFKVDLTKEREVHTLRESIQSRHGPIWGLVNLAGASSNGMSWKLSADEFRRILDVNLTANFLLAKEFIPGMREVSGGRIVNTSSVVAFTGIAGACHYASAKAGIVGLTRALSAELSNKNITVNALALGYFEYGMINTIPAALREEIRKKIPVGHFGHIAELGGLLEFLLDDKSSYVTGQVLHLNGGIYS